MILFLFIYLFLLKKKKIKGPQGAFVYYGIEKEKKGGKGIHQMSS
jgi:hypothetical protein